ncbi:hypothetical protein ACFWZ2_20785 [Streptomyces sp. NPDC059002]|uniref:hypothetical protein n=1 Tax=Streptomyces sp. NPDC059002 TaxID=3346690 RepID=UPI00369E43D3
MTDGADGTRAAEQEEERAEREERELRVFLERAVPQMSAPPDRIGRVRQRAARNRRRRIVAGAAASVAGLALAGVLLPGLSGGGGTGAVPPAATPPPAPEAERAVSYPELDALRLRLPEGWRALEIGEDARSKSPATGFAGTQRLAPYKQPCHALGADGWCSPLERLDPDRGMLLVLRADRSGSLARKAGDTPELRGRSLTKSCVLAGGGRSYLALVKSPDPDVVITAELCVADGATARIAEADGVLRSATFAPE